MSTQTAIEWTDATWNPVTGCTKISAGCDHCYAERLAERFRGVPGHALERGFDLQIRPERVDQPLTWRKPRRVFVNSMSDLFHKDIPREFVGRVFNTMERGDWHEYQVLTKRSTLLRSFINDRYTPSDPLPSHIWVGVSVEDRRSSRRIDHLRQTNAAIRFLSVEPLLEELGRLNLEGIHWVIVGGESGPGFRPMKAEWARSVRDQCVEANVPFFFKQWGGIRPKSAGNLLDGRIWAQYPRFQPHPAQEAFAYGARQAAGC
jgi:protein gp37